MFPSIEPSETGLTGLVWLFLSYGYVLFAASNLISEGSELLLLVPSLAGLVGGVVLPLLGAVPDGAIMLFSGLGDIESAQETLSVGVGALAGSTIMLLTIPWGLSIFAGRVDIVTKDGGLKKANYFGKPKVTPGRSMFEELGSTGVSITKEIRHGSFIMGLTTIPYFIIQIPASYLKNVDPENVASGEKYWALLGFVVCVTGFIAYLAIHVKQSKEDEERYHRTEVIKDLLKKGQVSLGGAFFDIVKTYGSTDTVPGENGNYGAVSNVDDAPCPKVKKYLEDVLAVPFQKYDKNNNKTLDFDEIKVFLMDFNERLSDEDVDSLFKKYDQDGDGSVNFEEFVLGCYSLILLSINPSAESGRSEDDASVAFANHLRQSVAEKDGDDDNVEEEEEVPPEIAELPADKQEAAIKKKAFSMLTLGTVMVLLFADPMVDVMQEIAVRAEIPPFYVSFILAPLASNASEVIASQFYAAKKTTQTMTVSLSALQGAAAMNNTFCLSIFMGLIYFRGLAWQYTAETIVILLVQFILVAMTKTDIMTSLSALYILSVFPLSILLVAVLEGVFGLD